MEWIKGNATPIQEYVLICTKTGLVRIAKRMTYNNHGQDVDVFSYGSTYYKDVKFWMRLPKPPTL